MAKELDFEAHDKPLIDVLFGNYKFSIPRYQRPYAWGEDQVADFWYDLTDNPIGAFFFGSFIFNYEKLDETGYIDIVDGQQRILTLMIFLAALRDVTKKYDSKLAELIQNKDICIDQRDGSLVKRVKCGESTNPFFSKYIQESENNIVDSKAGTKEEESIRKNYEYFINKIQSEIDRADLRIDKLEKLREFRSRIENIVVIHIQIPNEEDAYEIFETTNARGVDLNVADLVKNLVFKNLKAKEDKDLTKEIWQEIENNIQSAGSEMRKFLRYHWISKYNFVTEKKLYKHIKNENLGWDKFLEELWNASELYRILFQGNDDDWRSQEIKNAEEVYESISAIQSMNVTQCYVLLLSILRNYKKLGTDPTRVFNLIEKFSFMYSAICKLPGNKLERMYSRYAQKVEEIVKKESEKNIPSKIQFLFSEFEKEIKAEKPPFDYFLEQFQDVKYKGSEGGRLFIKYILNEINGWMEETREYKIAFSNVNVEHILPQKPDKEWGLSIVEIKPYVNLLGNLTLVDKKINSRIGNKPIKDKLPELEKSKLPITKKVIEQIRTNKNKWDRDAILERQNQLAKIAFAKVWDY
ncbi:MAG: hypothetical protein FD146_708 [Anaerolineaceae bacterium]|nr:MAG: hypothetical protein FD146_708 [Anaerolineaceae bacterium]